jgi:hypothetical protein
VLPGTSVRAEISKLEARLVSRVQETAGRPKRPGARPESPVRVKAETLKLPEEHRESPAPAMAEKPKVLAYGWLSGRGEKRARRVGWMRTIESRRPAQGSLMLRLVAFSFSISSVFEVCF